MKFKNLITFIVSFLGVPYVQGAGLDGMHDAPASQRSAHFDNAVHQAREALPTFQRDSLAVHEAASFYSGQNILNARDINYIDAYLSGHMPLEILFGLFEALRGFYSEEHGCFEPEGLNEGFTEQNYAFLCQVFGVARAEEANPAY